jgi:MFS family permease
MVMRRNVRGLTKMLPIGAGIFGVGLVLFGLSNSLWFSMTMMLVTGFGMMQGMVASNTILQTLVDEKMRGRVMSYYTMAFVGMAPFGALLSGFLAHVMGAQRTVIVSGVACLLGALWFWTRLKGIRAEMRLIYERLGIVPMPESRE